MSDPTGGGGGPRGGTGGRAPRRNVWRGILLCARFQPAGLEQFGDTPVAFMSSLIPLLVFPLMRALLLPQDADGLPRGTILMATLVALLATAVLSHLLAHAFGRDAAWLRYATAVNWNTWTLQFGVMAALIAAAGLASAGVRPTVAVLLSFAALAVYALWLQTFLARCGLRLAVGRALLLVLAVNLGAAALVAGPELVAQWLQADGMQAGGMQARESGRA